MGPRIIRPAARGDTRIGAYGGHPRGIPASTWPRCRVCGNPMCHMAQFDAGSWLDLGGFARLSAFICHATGGRCEDWDPWVGSNSVMLHRSLDNNLYDGPPTVRVYRRVPITLGPSPEPTDGPRAPVDQLNGRPTWLQGNATPAGTMGRPMRMVAQLSTEIVKFDITPTGVAYLFFDDDSAKGNARLLWQGQ